MSSEGASLRSRLILGSDRAAFRSKRSDNPPAWCRADEPLVHCLRRVTAYGARIVILPPKYVSHSPCHGLVF